MKTRTRGWRWREFMGYFLSLLVVGFGISLILISTIEVPEDSSQTTRLPYDPLFFLGSVILMILAAPVAGILRWRLKEFLVAFALATGFLMGNLGFAVGISILAAFLYLVGSKVSEVIAYYIPRQTECDGDTEEDV